MPASAKASRRRSANGFTLALTHDMVSLRSDHGSAVQGSHSWRHLPFSVRSTAAVRRLQYLALIVAMSSLARIALQEITSFFPKIKSREEVSIHPLRIKLGTVAQGQQIRFTFSLRNNTPRNIHRLSLQANCGCTLLEPSSDLTLVPKKPYIVQGVFDTNRTRGTKATHVLASWTTNSGSSQRIIAIEAEVTPVIEVFPDSLEFSTNHSASKDPVQIKRVCLHSISHIPFTIVNLRWAHPALTVTMPTVKSDNRQVTSTILDVAFDPRTMTARALTGTSYVEIATSIPSEPTLRVPIKILQSTRDQQ